MIEIIRRLIIGGVSLGVIVGNADTIETFFNDIVMVSQQVATAGDLRTISMMLDYEYLKRGRFPAPDRFINWMEKNFKENDLNELGRDHWGNLFVYRTFGNNKTYVLISKGPDSILDTADDLRRTGP